MLSKILNYFSSVFLYKSHFCINLYAYSTRITSLNINKNIIVSEKQSSKEINFFIESNILKQIFNYSQVKKCSHDLRRVKKVNSIIKKLNLYKYQLYNKQRYNFLYKTKLGFIDSYKLLNFETFHMTLKPWLNMYSFYISFINFGLFATSFNYSVSNFYFLGLVVLFV